MKSLWTLPRIYYSKSCDKEHRAKVLSYKHGKVKLLSFPTPPQELFDHQSFSLEYVEACPRECCIQSISHPNLKYDQSYQASNRKTDQLPALYLIADPDNSICA